MKKNYFDENPIRIQNLLMELLKSIKSVENRLENLNSKYQLNKDDKYEYLLIDDLANLFGVHKNTIYRYMVGGMLPYSKVGKQVIFLKKDIAAIVQQNYIERTKYMD